MVPPNRGHDGIVNVTEDLRVRVLVENIFDGLLLCITKVLRWDRVAQLSDHEANEFRERVELRLLEIIFSTFELIWMNGLRHSVAVCVQFTAT